MVKLHRETLNGVNGQGHAVDGFNIFEEIDKLLELSRRIAKGDHPKFTQKPKANGAQPTTVASTRASTPCVSKPAEDTHELNRGEQPRDIATPSLEQTLRKRLEQRKGTTKQKTASVTSQTTPFLISDDIQLPLAIGDGLDPVEDQGERLGATNEPSHRQAAAAIDEAQCQMVVAPVTAAEVITNDAEVLSVDEYDPHQPGLGQTKHGYPRPSSQNLILQAPSSSDRVLAEPITTGYDYSEVQAPLQDVLWRPQNDSSDRPPTDTQSFVYSEPRHYGHANEYFHQRGPSPFLAHATPDYDFAERPHPRSYQSEHFREPTDQLRPFVHATPALSTPVPGYSVPYQGLRYPPRPISRMDRSQSGRVYIPPRIVEHDRPLGPYPPGYDHRYPRSPPPLPYDRPADIGYLPPSFTNGGDRPRTGSVTSPRFRSLAPPHSGFAYASLPLHVPLPLRSPAPHVPSAMPPPLWARPLSPGRQASYRRVSAPVRRDYDLDPYSYGRVSYNELDRLSRDHPPVRREASQVSGYRPTDMNHSTDHMAPRSYY